MINENTTQLKDNLITRGTHSKLLTILCNETIKSKRQGKNSARNRYGKTAYEKKAL